MGLEPTITGFRDQRVYHSTTPQLYVICPTMSKDIYLHENINLGKFDPGQIKIEIPNQFQNVGIQLFGGPD